MGIWALGSCPGSASKEVAGPGAEQMENERLVESGWGETMKDSHQ